jgi:peptidoglycan/LPS O-acetylase OafA/YrhL
LTAQGARTTSAPRSERRPAPPTLGTTLGSADNALNFVRLGLALLVIFGHALPLGGFEPFTFGPFVHGGLHGTAVEGFFAISGFLIFASALRVPLLPYLWRRFLRIYPGYVTALMVTAFIAAPIAGALEEGARWSASAATNFVVGALDLKPSQDAIDHTLLNVPLPQVWNGSLWTLFYEGVAYVGVALLVLIPGVRRHVNVIVPILVAVMSAVYLFAPQEAYALLPNPLQPIAVNGLRLWTFFAWGMLAYTLAGRIRVRGLAAVAAWMVVLLATHWTALPAGLSQALILAALPAAVLLTGAVLPWRIGSRTDLSYGLYVYAFPIQQMLVLLGFHHYGWAFAALACAVLTIPVAWLSWIAVERPAMSLKGLIPTRRGVL